LKFKKILIVIILCSIIGITIGLFKLETNKNTIILATTTSASDSGLLDYLIPYFENETGVQVKVLVTGTGEALELGKRGDVDVILIHSRTDEDLFIKEECGVHRACIMYNDFIIVGPPNDPAGIKNRSIYEALNIIRQNQLKFVSRGDNSGTYKKEIFLWNKTGYIPNTKNDSWYLETGTGMGSTLVISSEKGAYTLTDRGTFLSYKSSLNLICLVEGDTDLLNPYGAILINPDKHPYVNFEEAKKFVGFLVSEKGQFLIGNFTINGEQLFHPLFGHCNELTNCSTQHEEIEYWKDYNGNYTG